MSIRKHLEKLFKPFGGVNKFKLNSLVGGDTMVWATDLKISSSSSFSTNLNPPTITVDYGDGYVLTLMADKINLPNE
jgi:hypothetical protein